MAAIAIGVAIEGATVRSYRNRGAVLVSLE